MKISDEKTPTEEKEDVFEIIRSPRVQDDDYLSVISNKLSSLDISRRPVYQQVGIGGITGW